MKKVRWFLREFFVLAVALAFGGTVAMAQSGQTSAAGNPDTELKTATSHAGFSAKADALKGVTMHLHHVLNDQASPSETFGPESSSNAWRSTACMDIPLVLLSWYPFVLLRPHASEPFLPWSAPAFTLALDPPCSPTMPGGEQEQRLPPGKRCQMNGRGPASPRRRLPPPRRSWWPLAEGSPRGPSNGRDLVLFSLSHDVSLSSLNAACSRGLSGQRILERRLDRTCLTVALTRNVSQAPRQ